MFRRRTRWADLVTALKQVTAEDLQRELSATRNMQAQAQQRGNVRDAINFGTRMDELLDQLVTLRAEG